MDPINEKNSWRFSIVRIFSPQLPLVFLQLHHDTLIFVPAIRATSSGEQGTVEPTLSVFLLYRSRQMLHLRQDDKSHAISNILAAVQICAVPSAIAVISTPRYPIKHGLSSTPK